MGPSVVVVTDNDPDQFKSTCLLNWVRYSKNFLLLSVNPSGGGSTVLFTGAGARRPFPFPRCSDWRHWVFPGHYKRGRIKILFQVLLVRLFPLT